MRIRTGLTDLVGVDHPIIQTGMGWVAGPSLVTGAANAGALGILAAATLNHDELHAAILEVKSRTSAPFGVNLRADAMDVEKRIDLLVREEVKVVSFALAPREGHIKKIKDAGIIVIPSVGAVRHAEKVAAWGADAVMIQGSEGGGHTGSTPTSLLLPAVLDAVDIPVIAAGGYADGRGLAAALSYGAAGIGMGTRFLLTWESKVPEAVKDLYLGHDLDGTVVTTKADGMPHRMLRTELVASLEEGTRLRRWASTARTAWQFKAMTELTWRQFVAEGRSMKAASGRSWQQMALAANTPMLLRAGLVEGRTDAGILASGQVVGLIDDLPSCQELVDRIVIEAKECIDRVEGLIGAVTTPDE